MEVKLLKPITLDEKKIEKIDLKLEEMTGVDILKVDLELRSEGYPNGMDNIYSQNVLLKIASKASGILPDDLQKLSIPDFLDVTFSVRNFLLGFSAKPEEQKNSEESLLS